MDGCDAALFNSNVNALQEEYDYFGSTHRAVYVIQDYHEEGDLENGDGNFILCNVVGDSSCTAVLSLRTRRMDRSFV